MDLVTVYSIRDIHTNELVYLGIDKAKAMDIAMDVTNPRSVRVEMTAATWGEWQETLKAMDA